MKIYVVYGDSFGENKNSGTCCDFLTSHIFGAFKSKENAINYIKSMWPNAKQSTEFLLNGQMWIDYITHESNIQPNTFLKCETYYGIQELELA